MRTGKLTGCRVRRMRSRHPRPLHLGDQMPGGVPRALHGWRAPNSPRPTLSGKDDLDARPP
eukprot:9036419-Lingulodinium_polyedra.AAC.1